MDNNIEFGYCCINLSMPDITVNRSCIKRTFMAKGLPYVSGLALQNVKDLVEIIKWNHKNNVKIYRMSSDMFPWMSEYSFEDLPDYNKIKNILKGAGTLAKTYGIRLSFHPGPFNVLGSPNPDAVTKTINDLNKHAEIMDLMGLDQSHYYPINIHCNGTYGDKDATLKRWCDSFAKLSTSAQRRLVVENDDRPNLYSVKELYEGIYENIGVPVTFDYHHHRLCSGEMTEQDAFEMAYSTWDVTPLFHYSSCKRTFEDSGANVRAHADYIYEKVNNYGKKIHVEFESKAKDLALLNYLQNNDKMLESYLAFDDYQQ